MSGACLGRLARSRTCRCAAGAPRRADGTGVRYVEVMTRSGKTLPRTADEREPSAPIDVVSAHASGVRAMRAQLMTMTRPGTSGTALTTSRQARAQWVDLLGELEAVKNAATAAQAELVVALEKVTRSEEAQQGVRADRRGRGVPSQVGAALRSSPHAGAAFLGTARTWVSEMPHTFDALRAGVLSQWRATLMVRETSHLAAEDRAQIDEQICGPANLAELARTGTKRLVARIKELAARLDVHACVSRNAKAVSERHVSVRPAPDLMVYLTALVPMQQGVQAYAQLRAHAGAARTAGDERGAGQIMADTLIERVTGRGPGQADDVPVTINLLVSDQALLAGGDRPAVVVEGAASGVGAVPAPVARALVARGIDADAAWLRQIYVNPRGRLLATTSASRFHPQGLANLLRAREQGICAMSWCDAAVRHIDHVVPHAEGGATSLDNGQGLCERCNHAKQAPGWSQVTAEVDGRQAVETTTPTGHRYTSVVPAPPDPVAPTRRARASIALRDGIGCVVRQPRGAILDRASAPPRPARSRYRQRSRPDLTWTHAGGRPYRTGWAGQGRVR